ncbi:hypothetical protein GCM10009760_59040 [Kitasatospora kazusensis]|uniref:Uncharacterized protein n=1 Tax=Kitasatospora kazusensis TaxID=407974 RepID=A0ABP5M0E7_9ACTN
MSTRTEQISGQAAPPECAECSRLDDLTARYGVRGWGHNPSGLGDVRVMRKRHADSGMCSPRVSRAA